MSVSRMRQKQDSLSLEEKAFPFLHFLHFLPPLHCVLHPSPRHALPSFFFLTPRFLHPETTVCDPFFPRPAVFALVSCNPFGERGKISQKDRGKHTDMNRESAITLSPSEQKRAPRPAVEFACPTFFCTSCVTYLLLLQLLLPAVPDSSNGLLIPIWDRECPLLYW